MPFAMMGRANAIAMMMWWFINRFQNLLPWAVNPILTVYNSIYVPLLQLMNIARHPFVATNTLAFAFDVLIRIRIIITITIIHITSYLAVFLAGINQIIIDMGSARNTVN